MDSARCSTKVARARDTKTHGLSLLFPLPDLRSELEYFESPSAACRMAMAPSLPPRSRSPKPMKPYAIRSPLVQVSGEVFFPNT